MRIGSDTVDSRRELDDAIAQASPMRRYDGAHSALVLRGLARSSEREAA